MYQSIYTPEEIARMKAQLEQSYQNAALQNQNINTATNMTKSLSPMANLGILLGTLGGKWGAQRLNDIWDARIDKGASLEKSFTNGLPASLRNLGRNIYTTPTSIDVAPALTQQNTNYNPVPSTALNPTQTNLMPNNAAPSTALFINDSPYFDWRNQNYLTHKVTRPPYFSIR